MTDQSVLKNDLPSLLLMELRTGGVGGRSKTTFDIFVSRGQEPSAVRYESPPRLTFARKNYPRWCRMCFSAARRMCWRLVRWTRDWSDKFRKEVQYPTELLCGSKWRPSFCILFFSSIPFSLTITLPMTITFYQALLISICRTIFITFSLILSFTISLTLYNFSVCSLLSLHTFLHI